jgi:hypothetical protein
MIIFVTQMNLNLSTGQYHLEEGGNYTCTSFGNNLFFSVNNVNSRASHTHTQESISYACVKINTHTHKIGERRITLPAQTILKINLTYENTVHFFTCFFNQPFDTGKPSCSRFFFIQNIFYKKFNK